MDLLLSVRMGNVCQNNLSVMELIMDVQVIFHSNVQMETVFQNQINAKQKSVLKRERFLVMMVLAPQQEKNVRMQWDVIQINHSDVQMGSVSIL